MAEIKPEDLRVTTINTGSGFVPRDNGVKIEHVPTGITVVCHEFRQQQQNRGRAMEMLRVALKDKEPSVVGVLVNPDALRQVILALCGPAHHIAELQMTRGLSKLIGCDNPIDILIENYNQWVSVQNGGA